MARYTITSSQTDEWYVKEFMTTKAATDWVQANLSSAYEWHISTAGITATVKAEEVS